MARGMALTLTQNIRCLCFDPTTKRRDQLVHSNVASRFAILFRVSPALFFSWIMHSNWVVLFHESLNVLLVSMAFLATF
jgi:hypothetical protein